MFEKHCLSDLCDTFPVFNRISGAKCVKPEVGYSIDVIGTNRPRSFHHTSLIETGMNDCHKLIQPFFRVYFKQMSAKTI